MEGSNKTNVWSLFSARWLWWAENKIDCQARKQLKVLEKVSGAFSGVLEKYQNSVHPSLPFPIECRESVWANCVKNGNTEKLQAALLRKY